MPKTIHKMNLSKGTEIIINGQKYILEDDGVLIEGVIGNVLKKLISVVIPYDVFVKMNPYVKQWVASIAKDKRKSMQLKKIFKDNPDLVDLFAE